MYVEAGNSYPTTGSTDFWELQYGRYLLKLLGALREIRFPQFPNLLFVVHLIDCLFILQHRVKNNCGMECARAKLPYPVGDLAVIARFMPRYTRNHEVPTLLHMVKTFCMFEMLF